MSKKSLKTLLLQFDYWSFIAALLLTAWLWSQPTLLSFLLLVLLIILLRKRNKEVVLFAFITGILGVAAEIIGIHFGAWQYASPQWFGIPSWLFFLWALAGMFFRRIQIDLKYFLGK